MKRIMGVSAVLVSIMSTPVLAVPVVFAMAGAAFVVHAGDPLSMQTAAEAFFSGESENWFSKEPALLFLIPFLSLAFTGPGRLSVDYVIWSRRGSSGAENPAS